jgi:hypothetical protein
MMVYRLACMIFFKKSTFINIAIALFIMVGLIFADDSVDLSKTCITLPVFYNSCNFSDTAT